LQFPRTRFLGRQRPGGAGNRRTSPSVPRLDGASERGGRCWVSRPHLPRAWDVEEGAGVTIPKQAVKVSIGGDEYTTVRFGVSLPSTTRGSGGLPSTPQILLVRARCLPTLDGQKVRRARRPSPITDELFPGQAGGPGDGRPVSPRWADEPCQTPPAPPSGGDVLPGGTVAPRLSDPCPAAPLRRWRDRSDVPRPLLLAIFGGLAGQCGRGPPHGPCSTSSAKRASGEGIVPPRPANGRGGDGHPTPCREGPPRQREKDDPRGAGGRSSSSGKRSRRKGQRPSATSRGPPGGVASRSADRELEEPRPAACQQAERGVGDRESSLPAAARRNSPTASRRWNGSRRRSSPAWERPRRPHRRRGQEGADPPRRGRGPAPRPRPLARDIRENAKRDAQKGRPAASCRWRSSASPAESHRREPTVSNRGVAERNEMKGRIIGREGRNNPRLRAGHRRRRHHRRPPPDNRRRLLLSTPSGARPPAGPSRRLIVERPHPIRAASKEVVAKARKDLEDRTLVGAR